MSFTQSWFLSVVPIGTAIIMHFVNTNKMKEAHSATGGVIRSRRDLRLVRDAINMSMTLAIAYLAMFGILIVVGFSMMLTKTIHPLVFFGHIFIFGVVTLPIGLIGKTFENRIKKMQVESEDDSITAIYQDFLKQWNKPQLKIKETEPLG